MQVIDGSHKSAWDVMAYLIKYEGWYPDPDGGICNHHPNEWLCRSCGYVGDKKAFYRRWLCRACQNIRVQVSQERNIIGIFSHV